MPEILKEAVVRGLLRKSNLEPVDFSNYRLNSNVPFLSSEPECAMGKQLQGFLKETDLPDSFQFFRPGNRRNCLGCLD